MSRVDRVIDGLGRIADHRYTILAGWLSPFGILVLPESLEMTYFVCLLGLFLILHQAQLARPVEDRS